MEFAEFLPVLTAIGLGLLVGVQREPSSALAGVRTFPLITLLGVLCAMITDWAIVVGFIAVSLMFFVGNLAQFREEKVRAGVTTEIAGLVMFAVGAALTKGYTTHAIVIGGVVGVILNWKKDLRSFIGKMSRDDFKAIFQLVLIGLIILPILPNRTYGWYQVVNPYKVWLMVVLISGISLAAYIAHKFLGDRGGTIVAGVLGGLISSTATTVSFARQTKENAHATPMATLVILVASTIALGRTLLLIGIVAPRFLTHAIAPLGMEMALMAILCLFIFPKMRRTPFDSFTHRNPAQLTTAIVFGVLYVGVLLVTAAGKAYWGVKGVYAVAILSGLTDMDAITLSIAELVKLEQLTAENGWRLILLAALSNLVFKGGAVMLLGDRNLLRVVSVLFGISIAGGGILLGLWPN